MLTYKQLSLFPNWEQKKISQVRKFRSISTIASNISDCNKRKLKFENEHLLHGIPREGILEMPKARPVYLKSLPKLYVPFNCLKKCNTTHACVHFYIDDYRFNRVWQNLEHYMEMFVKYDVVISTDNSVFLDVPLIDNMCNVFKNRVFTAVGQRMGVNVIPSFSCGNPKDIDLYCDGLPDGGCIAVGGMGTNKNRSERAIFKYCVREMCERKHPNLLLIYGNNTDLDLDIPVVRIPTYVENLRKRLSK